jgi:hypothetical protein
LSQRRGACGGEVDGKLEEAGVAVELLGRDQTSQDTNGHLEVLDLHVEVEVELGQDQVLGLCRLGGQAHQDHGVKGVDRGYEQGGWVPVGVGLGQRLELVVAPSVLLVAVPGVGELGAETVWGDEASVLGGVVRVRDGWARHQGVLQGVFLIESGLSH